MLKSFQSEFRLKLFTTIIFLLMILPFMLSAGTLTGKVTDKTDGSGLSNAIITVNSTNPSINSKSVPANIDGNYTISNLTAGTYNVRFSYVGFTTVNQEVNISEAGETVLNIEMTSSVITLGSISVTASRKIEKIVDAPAAVNIVASQEITERTTLTPTDHVKGMPAVDIAQTGLNQSNVVIRGFNNIFSGAMLVLTDNRIARVPSLRFNAHNFISTVNTDIDRIEIVSGPGSALYGPNSSNGIMHIITKSPFSSEGTKVTLGGGERDLAMGSFRTAKVVTDDFAYKLTAQYYQGHDWEISDSLEPAMIRKFKPTSTGPVYVDDEPIPNIRDFDIKKLSFESRFDFNLGDNTALIINGGWNRNNGIELTGLGAGQAIDWTYKYAQARLTYKDLFVQTFVNASDAGDTYLLRTGQLIVDKSKLWVGQIQHSYYPNDKLSFTYGVDALWTRPQTESTINGRNEDDDNINEYGAYVQSEAKLSDQVKLVGAARVDDHNRLEDPVFSPRAALVFQPNDNHNLRLTFNKAFSTPDNNNLYLDLLQNADPFGIGAAFESSLGYAPDIDIRVQGVPLTGWNWRFDESGNPYFRSSFAPSAGLTSEDFIPYNDPLFTNAVMWGIGSGAVLSGLSDQLDAAVAGSLLDPGTAAALLAAVADATPDVFGHQLHNTMMRFNPDILGFEPFAVSDFVDIQRMKPTNTKTFEIGYKGVIDNKFQMSIDAYRTEKDNFVGPLTVETPNVFIDPVTLQTGLTTDYGTYYATADPGTQAILNILDNPAFGGNNNGNPVDELVTMFTTGAASIPFGTVSPVEQRNPDAVLVTYRNFGDIHYYGLDLAFAYHLNHHWDLGGTYSYVSKNFWDKDEENAAHDIYLNAPKNKFGASLKFTHQNHNISAKLRFRYVDAFDMASPFVGLRVDQYEIFDFTIGADAAPGIRFNLSVQNLFDNKHFEFVGAPEIGRLAILTGSYSF